MTANQVDGTFRRAKEIADFLQESGQISFMTEADDKFRKVLLLAAASFFEVYLTDSVRTFVLGALGETHPLYKIVKTKGIDRQYHAWFDWEKRTAEKFFGLFGDGFKAFMKAKTESDERLIASIAAFLELGELRNQMVHGNFASFTLEKTLQEVYELYMSAATFVYSMHGFLGEYLLAK